MRLGHLDVNYDDVHLDYIVNGWMLLTFDDSLAFGGLVEVLDQIGDVIVVVLVFLVVLLAFAAFVGGGGVGRRGHVRGQLLEVSQRLCAQLIEDSGQQFGDLLVLGVSRHRERVGGQRGLHLRVVEVDHGAVVLDHVDLFDARDGVHGQLLQRGLQLLVVGRGGPVHHLLLPAGGAFAADTNLRLKLLQFLLIHLYLRALYIHLM